MSLIAAAGFNPTGRTQPEADKIRTDAYLWPPLQGPAGRRRSLQTPNNQVICVKADVPKVLNDRNERCFKAASFSDIAFDGREVPEAAIVFLCCGRSQRDKCGYREILHAVVQRNNRPFVDVAAWIWR